MKEKEEDIRETYLSASTQNRFVTYKTEVITKTIHVDPTLDEFKKIMIEKSPVFIYCDEWSTKKPIYQIKELIYPSHEGVTFTCLAWADKTPVFWKWEDFYKEIKSQGFKYFRF